MKYLQPKSLILALSLIHGASWAAERFSQGNGKQANCVIDHQTNLMWSRTPLEGKYTWDEAKTAIKKLNLCGYSDWRLPAHEEQFKLQDQAGHYAPFAWLNTHGFSQVQTEFYWSGDAYAPNSNRAWGFYMYSGKVYDEVKASRNYAWPVRTIK